MIKKLSVLSFCVHQFSPSHHHHGGAITTHDIEVLKQLNLRILFDVLLIQIFSVHVWIKASKQVLRTHI